MKSYQITGKSGKSVAQLALLLMLAAPVWAAQQFQRPVPPPFPRQLPAPRPTPEIDPGVARGAVTILIGGLLIVRDRRRQSS